MDDELHIRELKPTDSQVIYELNHQLGYTLSLSAIESQLKTILKDKGHIAIVATDGNKVIGYLHGCYTIRLTSKPFVEIVGFVVDEQYRSKGIGKRLLDHFEKTISLNTKSVRVRCNLKRERAHHFYKSTGYIEKKQQVVFQRNLA